MLDMPHSFVFGLAPSAARGLRENTHRLAQTATRRAQPGASAKSAEQRARLTNGLTIRGCMEPPEGLPRETGTP